MGQEGTAQPKGKGKETRAGRVSPAPLSLEAVERSAYPGCVALGQSLSLSELYFSLCILGTTRAPILIRL